MGGFVQCRHEQMKQFTLVILQARMCMIISGYADAPLCRWEEVTEKEGERERLRERDGRESKHNVVNVIQQARKY